MPRQDVPYGGAICRLKERIAEIWDELGKKLHSINGVEGDGAGDVKIVSGDAAVVVTSDQVNHEIEIALDSSQLPAASVASVNGQTGAVALDAGDIPSDGNSDVQTDIDVNKAAISACSSAITSEQLARQNADSTLQGNINTLSASIPTAAATAVANDPTVAQLATDVPNKVDKITSGSSLKAYTHTGTTQGETSVVDGTTANSIGIRDANGRMQAADPASGATDKTLVTANWVSQTGDNGPNNLIHKSGNERKTGLLYTSTPFLFSFRTVKGVSSTSRTNYYRVGSFSKQTSKVFYLNITGGLNNTRLSDAEIIVAIGSSESDVKLIVLRNQCVSPSWCVNVKLVRTATSIDLWVREAQYVTYGTRINKCISYGEMTASISGFAVGDNAVSADPANYTGTIAVIASSTMTEYTIDP